MTQQFAWLLLGMLLLTSCATPRQPETARSRFNEENNADIVIRHYSDEVNRVLKPLQMQGPFLSTFDKGSVLDLATQQSGRELAVVILLKSNTSDNVKQDWVKILKEAGYKRIVFLRADTPGLRINGLPVLDSIKAKAAQTDEQEML
jgi:hypothetical protein